MPNLNRQDARTYNPAPTLWKYDPRTNTPWLKLTDASSNTAWFPINLNQFPQSVVMNGPAVSSCQGRLWVLHNGWDVHTCRTQTFYAAVGGHETFVALVHASTRASLPMPN